MKQRTLSLFLALFASSSIAFASSGVWRSIGPFDGIVYSIAIDAKNLETVYVASPAGIFKTIDGGASWSSINPGVYPQALVIDPRDSQIVFAGTINGLLKSVDGGANWYGANSGLGRYPNYSGRPGPYAGVNALTLDPQNADILYAGTNAGLFKSIDGGESWVGVNAGLPTFPVGPGTVRNLDINLVVIDPRNPMTIYASGSDNFSVNGQIGCCKSALFKSTDGGASWNTLPDILPPTSTSSPAAAPRISSLIIDQNAPNTLYLTRFCNCPLLKSTNGGGSWRNSGPAFPDGSTVIPMSRIAVDASSPNIFYGQTSAGFMKSVDFGAHWTSANLPPNISAFRIAVNAGTLYVESDSNSNGAVRGFFKSADAGETWKNVSAGLSAAYVTTLAVDPQNSNTIYAGGNGIMKSIDAGSTWTDQRANFAPITMAIDPHNPRTLYVGSWDEELGGPVSVFTSTDAGSTWNGAASGFPGNAGIQSLAVDPYNSSLILAGTNLGLFKSADGGANWAAVDKFTGTYIRSVIFDPLTRGMLYVGTSNDVWKSVDAADSWELAYGGKTGVGAVLAIDAQTPKTLYAAISYPNLVILKTADGGHSWTTLSSSGLPDDANLIGGLIVDPKNSNTLYLATSGALLDSCTVPCSGLNDGVFRSKDDGKSWFAVNFGLTTPHVFSLSIDPQNTDRLYAGTLGGGVFSITFAAAPIVSGLRFDRVGVAEGATYIGTFAGQNLDGDTFFDVQFTAPDGSSGVALNWQRGAVASHDVTAGTTLGSWTITGVRPHDFDADHSGNFAAVSATITVGR